MSKAFPPSSTDSLPVPDAHGQAAILLVESLIHSLVERSVLSLEEAVNVVDTAAQIKAEVADSWGDTPEALTRSLAILENILGSLRNDQGDERSGPDGQASGLQTDS